MPPRSSMARRKDAAVALGEIESAHAVVGGGGRGRRYATQQINQAYAVLLSSRFDAQCPKRKRHLVAANSGSGTGSPWTREAIVKLANSWKTEGLSVSADANWSPFAGKLSLRKRCGSMKFPPRKSS